MPPPVIAVVQTAGQIIWGSEQLFMVIGCIRECKSFFEKFSRFFQGGGGARKGNGEVQGGMEWSTGLEACRHLGAALGSNPSSRATNRLRSTFSASPFSFRPVDSCPNFPLWSRQLIHQTRVSRAEKN